MKYDRQLLLMGPKRNAVLELAEIEAYGSDSYADADYVCLYGLRPREWHAKGIRLLGRTAVECTRDVFADRIGKDVASVAAGATSSVPPLIVDPFAGSGNTLYWLVRRAPGARGIGFESDAGVFALTQSNLAILKLPIEVFCSDYRSRMADIQVSPRQLLIVFVAPPWGDALDPVAGLDLRRTYPPIAGITDGFRSRFEDNPILFVIQVHESVNKASLAELTASFDWSASRIYDLNAPGQNHGVVLAACRWIPTPR